MSQTATSLSSSRRPSYNAKNEMARRELGFWEGYQINTGIVLSLS